MMDHVVVLTLLVHCIHAVIPNLKIFIGIIIIIIQNSRVRVSSQMLQEKTQRVLLWFSQRVLCMVTDCIATIVLSTYVHIHIYIAVHF